MRNPAPQVALAQGRALLRVKTLRNPFLLAAALGFAACAPRADAGPDRWQVGFGQAVTLDGSRSRGDSFEWTQLAGPKVDLADAHAKVSHFTTRPIGEVLPLSEYPGPIAMGLQGLYKFRLTARKRDGKSSFAEVTVTSASMSPATGGVPIDIDVYINGGPREAFDWKLELPTDSKTQLLDATTRTPHFRPDVRGAYHVTEHKSGYNFVIWSGRFDLVPKDCGRSDCHPKEEKAWEKTRHAKAARHEPECVRCHSVGFDPGANNGGYDEACPQGRCDAEHEVLGVVHCLACHGPGFRSAANYAEGACQQCHDAPPKYTKVAEWRQAKMSHLTAGLDPVAQALGAGCPDCHSSQGFVRWMKDKPNAHRGLGQVFAAPIACPTCHDPHSAENPHQLRVYGEVTTRSGLHLAGIGEGALCATCHNAGAPRDEAIRARKAPHAPQADLLAQSKLEKEAPDLCVTCHVQKDHGGGGHTFEAGGERAQRAKTLRAEIEPLITAARVKMSARLAKLTACSDGRKGAGVTTRGEMMVVVDDSGHDLGDCDRNGKIAAGEISMLVPKGALAEDAYDLLTIENDRSFGFHNPELTRQILGRLTAGAGKK